MCNCLQQLSGYQLLNSTEDNKMRWQKQTCLKYFFSNYNFLINVRKVFANANALHQLLSKHVWTLNTPGVYAAIVSTAVSVAVNVMTLSKRLSGWLHEIEGLKVVSSYIKTIRIDFLQYFAWFVAHIFSKLNLMQVCLQLTGLTKLWGWDDVLKSFVWFNSLHFHY